MAEQKSIMGLAERSTRNFGVLTAEEAGEAQETTSEEIIRSATDVPVISRLEILGVYPWNIETRKFRDVR